MSPLPPSPSNLPQSKLKVGEYLLPDRFEDLNTKGILEDNFADRGLI